MIAGGVGLATDEVSRHSARLIAIDRASDRIALRAFSALPSLLRAGDVVVVNDAATLPGSLRGSTGDGATFELRLSGPIENDRLVGVVLGDGDWRTRTEDRAVPPRVIAGDAVAIAGIAARVVFAGGRRIELAVDVPADELWRALYANGAPVQYAYRREPLPLYAVQTAYASRPWAAEMPSAGRPLTWSVMLDLRRSGIEIATVTHAAGLSSTGDVALDRALPWPERYDVPLRTSESIARARDSGGRIVAIGTSVVRALESSGGEAGPGVATLRLGVRYASRVVDGVVSGLHVPGESHFELLRAFAPRDRLDRALALAAVHGLSGHELGDACLIL